MNIEQLESANDASIDSRLNRHAETLTLIKVFVILGGTAIIGLAQFMTASSWSVWTLVGVAATAVVFVGAVIIARTDGNAPIEIATARNAIAEARQAEFRAREAEAIYRYKGSDGGLEEDARHARELYLAMNAMRAVLESIRSGSKSSQEKWPTALLTAAEPHMKVALGFSIEHQWNIDLFQAVRDEISGDVVLRLVSTRRSNDCDLAKARDWKVGVGYPGVTYANGHEIVVGDTQDPSIAQMFPIDGKKRGHDDDRYLSFAAVPVKVGGGDTCWGVVIATINQFHHFNLEEDDGVHPTECVRALAGMVALGVVLAGGQDSGAKSDTIISKGATDVEHADDGAKAIRVRRGGD